MPAKQTVWIHSGTCGLLKASEASQTRTLPSTFPLFPKKSSYELATSIIPVLFGEDESRSTLLVYLVCGLNAPNEALVARPMADPKLSRLFGVENLYTAQSENSPKLTR